MSLIQIIQSQLLEPFRIVLLIALMVTTLRTSHQTGRAIPLALGIVFVAVVTKLNSEGDRLEPMAVGIVTNIILVAIIFGLTQLWLRFSRRS